MLCSSATFPGKAAATAEKLIPLFPRQRSPFYSRRGQNHDQKMSRIHFPRAPPPTRPVQSSSPYSTLPASTVQQPYITVKMFLSDYVSVGRRALERFAFYNYYLHTWVQMWLSKLSGASIPSFGILPIGGRSTPLSSTHSIRNHFRYKEFATECNLHFH